MKGTKIDVTPGDIRAGYHGSTRRSPIALAVLRHVPPGVGVIDSGEDITFRVKPSYAHPKGKWIVSDLPGEACDFSRHFEASRYGPCSRVEPFSFELPIPDETDLKVAA